MIQRNTVDVLRELGCYSPEDWRPVYFDDMSLLCSERDAVRYEQWLVAGDDHVRVHRHSPEDEWADMAYFEGCAGEHWLGPLRSVADLYDTLGDYLQRHFEDFDATSPRPHTKIHPLLLAVREHREEGSNAKRNDMENTESPGRSALLAQVGVELPDRQEPRVSRAYYSTRVGKGHLLMLVKHDSHSMVTASAAYCSPKDEFDPLGETEVGRKARMIAEGRMKCTRKRNDQTLNYATKVVVSSVQENQIHLVLPLLRHRLCQLPCAPGWAKRATRRSGTLFVGVA